MKVCSVCQRCYEDAAASCEENHGSLRFARSGSREMIAGYRLDVLLESGAGGEIYKATHVALNQPFVIKIVILNSANGAEQTRQKLQTEAQTAARIEHQNVAHVYESGWLESGDFYTITELVEGQSLRQYLRNTGSLSESEAVIVARQTAEALEAAHAGGVIHRAVSPANIIVQHDEENQLSIKLCNFDFAGLRQQSAVAAISSPHLPIDVLRYLSPEQCSGQPVDARTDIYSLGVVLYEMLCGRSPFDAPTAAAIVFKPINEKPLQQLRYDVRALLVYVLKQSVNKALPTRLPSAGNFVSQLRQIERLVVPPPTTLRGATAENLSTVKIVSGTANASDEISMPEINESPLENYESLEMTVPEIADDSAAIIPTIPVVAQSPVEEAKEDTVNESDFFGEPEQIFVRKKIAAGESFEAETIHVKRKETDAAVFESQPILIRKKEFTDAPLESEPIQVKRKENIIAAASETDFSPVINVEDTRKPQPSASNFSYLNGENRAPHQHTPTGRPLLIGAGLLALLAAVGLGMFLYSRQQSSEPAIADATSIPSASQLPKPNTNVSDETIASAQPEVTGIEDTAPIVTEKPSVTAAKRENQIQPREENLTNEIAAQPNESIQNQPTRETVAEEIEPEGKNQPRQATEDGSEQTKLNASLNEWIGATNDRDIERQMNYYAPKVNAYYRTRNVSPEAVRAEKQRIFERAGAVDIQTGKPEIVVSPDGRNATMRFRKKYSIKEGQRNRSGEVIQELRWVKSGSGWKIVSERDVKVINR